MDRVWYNAMAEGRKLGCLLEIVSIAALAAAQLQHSIFFRPLASRDDADAARQTFARPLSDHLSQLSALHAYMQAKGAKDEDAWCQHWYINRRVLEEALRIRGLLVRWAQTKFGDITTGNMSSGDKNHASNIFKALARSLFCNVAIRDPGSKAAKGEGPIVENEDDLYHTVHRNIKPEWVIVSSWLHHIFCFHSNTLQDLPYFQDDKLARKRNDVLRQPYVKASLDRARESTVATSTSAST